MAEECKVVSDSQVQESGEVEVQDRGLFDHFGKKNDKVDVQKVHIEDEVKENKVEEKKESLLQKLHRSSSSSSSSSDEEEEVEVDGVLVKQKKKKGLKEKIKEKLGGHKVDGEDKKQEVFVVQEVEAATVTNHDSYNDTEVKIEKVEANIHVEATQEEEKKGFFDKIMEKLPGHKKPAEEVVVVEGSGEGDHGHDGKEKKGIIGKIMEKLPGYHKEEKGSEKTGGASTH